eukprot:2789307-Prymnesium_polylepis.1
MCSRLGSSISWGGSCRGRSFADTRDVCLVFGLVVDGLRSDPASRAVRVMARLDYRVLVRTRP